MEKYQISNTIVIINILIIISLLNGCEKNMKVMQESEKKLISNSKVFSELASTSRLNDKQINDFSVGDIEANNSTIRNFIWYKVDIDGRFENYTFKNGKIIGSFLENSNFENVTFENIIFDNVVLNYSNFKNTKFIKCHIKKISHWHLDKQIDIEFIDSKLDDLGMLDLSGQINFKNTKSNDILLVAKNGSMKLNIKEGEFEGEINGNIKTNVENMKSFHASINPKNLGEVSISNIDKLGLSVGNINTININNIKYLDFITLNKNIKDANIHNIDDGYYINTIDAGQNLGNIKISNAKIQRLALENFEGNLELENVKASLWDFNEAKVGTLKIKNVEMFYPLKSDFDVYYKVNRDPNAPYVFNFKNAKINNMVIDGYKHYPGVKFNSEGMIINKATKFMPDNNEVEISQQDVVELFK